MKSNKKTIKMKGMKKKFMSYAIFMAAAAAAQPDFYTGASRGYAKKMTKQDLPRWNVGGQIIFAKDAKTAEKYAKKRGLWRP